jgi:DNA helicase II / ATP-dependent DNA helicase PcrA
MIELNEAQARAVTAPEGHLLINAAAGTGKTTTIAARILFLQVEMGIPASSMMSISFSRAARLQLLEKLQNMAMEIGQGSPVSTFTFHGLAYRILRLAANMGETWLKPGFEVVQGAGEASLFFNHRRELLAGIKDEFDRSIAPELYAKALDIARQGHYSLGEAFLDPEDLPGEGTIIVPYEFTGRVEVPVSNVRIVWERYQRILRKHNAIDYPGLILEAHRAIAHRKGATRERIKDGLKYIIVDEYQDTSRAQERFLFDLAGNDVFLNVVGDNDQAIYTFNGSDVSNILYFPKRVTVSGLPVLEPIDLTENYRSTPNIIMLANRILEKQNRPVPKKLEPAKLRLRRDSLVNYPVKRINAPRLELAADFVAREISRLVNEGIPASEIAVLVRKDSEFSRQGGVVRDALKELGVAISSGKKEHERKLLVMRALLEICQYRYGDDIDSLIQQIASGYCDGELAGTTREELVNTLEEAKLAGAAVSYEVIDLLHEHVDAENTTPTGEGVHIQTIHSAKGKEYRVVFLMYLGDKSFPHSSRPDIEEERRLLYVGITRARERLYVIGTHGKRFADFFGDCAGEGVEHVEYLVPGGVELQGDTFLDDNMMEQLLIAEKQQEEEEERFRAELARFFEEEDNQPR